jgi:hypothetical protein
LRVVDSNGRAAVTSDALLTDLDLFAADTWRADVFRRLRAVHEAGHAVVAHSFGYQLRTVTIIAGLVDFASVPERCTRCDVVDEICVSMAGHAAELVANSVGFVDPRPPGYVEPELSTEALIEQCAEGLVPAAARHWTRCESDDPATDYGRVDNLAYFAIGAQRAVRRTLTEHCRAVTVATLTTPRLWRRVEALATALLEAGELTGPDVLAVFAAADDQKGTTWP